VIHRTQSILKIAALSVFLISSAAVIAQKKDKEPKKKTPPDLPGLIWQDPGDISSLNLIYGIGGAADAPDPNGTYTFIEEDMNAPVQRLK